MTRARMGSQRMLVAAVCAAALLAGLACASRVDRARDPRHARSGDRSAAAARAPAAEPASFEGVGPLGDEALHLARIRQLTFGGQNAEAYFSPDDARIIFQATPDSLECDQIFTMRADGSDKRMVSTGAGVTTCGYFFYPAGERILFSSTHLADRRCPPRPSHERGYVWPLHPGYDVFTARPDGSDLQRVSATPGYDAEATFSRDGSRIVFTSVRDGDLELYTMKPDGGGVKRLTHEEGYDGGAFFSYDGSRIVYRAHHPVDERELADYRALLADNLVRPTRMEIWIMNADGTGKRPLTANGAANFAPYFFPQGDRVVFASNMADSAGRNFDLYAVGVDGEGLERITTHPDFDAFPMFNTDGTELLWASNRNNSRPRETNVFIADWRE